MAERPSNVNTSTLPTEELSIETVLSESKRDAAKPPREGRQCLAQLVGLIDGQPQVELAGTVKSARLCRRLKNVLSKEHIGQDVLLLWSSQDPVIIDLIEDRVDEESLDSVDTTIDGRRIHLEASDEIVLRCGNASITLRRNGRVVIRGAYVETRAKGTNRIKGGSVQIN